MGRIPRGVTARAVRGRLEGVGGAGRSLYFLRGGRGGLWARRRQPQRLFTAFFSWQCVCSLHCSVSVLHWLVGAAMGGGGRDCPPMPMCLAGPGAAASREGEGVGGEGGAPRPGCHGGIVGGGGAPTPTPVQSARYQTRPHSYPRLSWRACGGGGGAAAHLRSKVTTTGHYSPVSGPPSSTRSGDQSSFGAPPQ